MSVCHNKSPMSSCLGTYPLRLVEHIFPIDYFPFGSDFLCVQSCCPEYIALVCRLTSCDNQHCLRQSQFDLFLTASPACLTSTETLRFLIFFSMLVKLLRLFFVSTRSNLSNGLDYQLKMGLDHLYHQIQSPVPSCILRDLACNKQVLNWHEVNEVMKIQHVKFKGAFAWQCGLEGLFVETAGSHGAIGASSGERFLIIRAHGATTQVLEDMILDSKDPKTQEIVRWIKDLICNAPLQPIPNLEDYYLRLRGATDVVA